MGWLDREKRQTTLRLPIDSLRFAGMRAKSLGKPLSRYLTNLIDADWDKVVAKGESKWEPRKA